jgi:hypothetical protein
LFKVYIVVFARGLRSSFTNSPVVQDQVSQNRDWFKIKSHNFKTWEFKVKILKTIAMVRIKITPTRQERAAARASERERQQAIERAREIMRRRRELQEVRRENEDVERENEEQRLRRQVEDLQHALRRRGRRENRQVRQRQIHQAMANAARTAFYQTHNIVHPIFPSESESEDSESESEEDSD